jgi:hypothetical protein
MLQHILILQVPPKGREKMQLARTNRQRWRVSSLLLLALFLFLQVFPFVSSQTTNEASLHACCRTRGKHHCAMNTNLLTGSQSSNSSPVFAQLTEKCPYLPASPVNLHGHSFKPTLAALVFAGIVSHPVRRPQAEAQRRISFDRSRQKRGPPSSVLL